MVNIDGKASEYLDSDKISSLTSGREHVQFNAQGYQRASAGDTAMMYERHESNTPNKALMLS
jgi:hypothetical protein